MESENPAADQLPEAESLPDGFVGDTSTTDPLPPKTPEPDHEGNLIGPHLNPHEECKCKKSHANVGEDHIRVENCKYLSRFNLCLPLGVLFLGLGIVISVFTVGLSVISVT